MASGWNLWVWLQCIGVVSGCCCKDILTIIITFIEALVFHFNKSYILFEVAANSVLRPFLKEIRFKKLKL